MKGSNQMLGLHDWQDDPTVVAQRRRRKVIEHKPEADEGYS